MLTEVKKNIKLIFLCFKYNLLRAMDNRASFIGQIIGMILNNASMILQWVVLFSLKDNIGGYALKEVIVLWAISASVYGVAHTFFENASFMSQLIVYGELDAFLVQPKDTLIYAASSKMKVSAIGDIIFSVLVLLFVRVSFLTWLLFILFTILGGIIYASMAIIYHSFTFFLGNTEDFAVAMESMMVNTATYPDGIFSGKIKWLFMTIVPIGFSIYMPMNVMINHNYILILIVFAFAVSISSLAYFLFNKGLKKYTSGNLMTSRV